MASRRWLHAGASGRVAALNVRCFVGAVRAFASVPATRTRRTTHSKERSTPEARHVGHPHQQQQQQQQQSTDVSNASAQHASPWTPHAGHTETASSTASGSASDEEQVSSIPSYLPGDSVLPWGARRVVVTGSDAADLDKRLHQATQSWTSSNVRETPRREERRLSVHEMKHLRFLVNQVCMYVPVGGGTV